MIFGHSLEKPVHCDFGNKSRHLAAEAEMLAGTEAEMALRPPLDVVHVRIGEFAPIAVSGAKGEGHLVADAQRLTMQLLLAHDGSLEALRRSIETQGFLDCSCRQLGIGSDAAAGVRVVMQIEC